MLPGIAELTSKSVDQTTRLGVRLGELLRAGDVICLSGDLGAGKTTLTRGIGRGWGALEAVTSPTFTFVHEHHRRLDDQILYHVDCYRLNGREDAWSIGFEDLLNDRGAVVIEWPEHIAEVLPPERLWITLTMAGDTERFIQLQATGERYLSLVEILRQNK